MGRPCNEATIEFLKNVDGKEEFYFDDEYEKVKDLIKLQDADDELEKVKIDYFRSIVCNQQSNGTRVFRKDPARENKWVNVNLTTDAEALERIENHLIEMRRDYNNSIKSVRKKKNLVLKNQISFIKQTNENVVCMTVDEIGKEA